MAGNESRPSFGEGKAIERKTCAQNTATNFLNQDQFGTTESGLMEQFPTSAG